MGRITQLRNESRSDEIKIIFKDGSLRDEAERTLNKAKIGVRPFPPNQLRASEDDEDKIIAILDKAKIKYSIGW